MVKKLLFCFVLIFVFATSVFAQTPENIKMISCQEIKDSKVGGGIRVDYQFMQFDQNNPSKWQLKTASKPKFECGEIPTEIVSERGIKSIKNVQVSYETFCADVQKVDRKINECEGRCMSPPGRCEKLKKLPEVVTQGKAPKGDKVVTKDCCVLYERVEFVKNDRQAKRDIYKGLSAPLNIKGGICGNEKLGDSYGGIEGFWITQKVNNACELNNLLPATPTPQPAPTPTAQITCTNPHFWSNTWQELDTTKLPTNFMFYINYNNIALKGSDFLIAFTPDQGQEISFTGPGNFDKDPNQPRVSSNDGWNNNPVSSVENDPNAQGRMFNVALDFPSQNQGSGKFKVIAKGTNQVCYEKQITIGTPTATPAVPQTPAQTPQLTQQPTPTSQPAPSPTPTPSCTTQPQISFILLANDRGVAIKIIDPCKNTLGQQDQLVQDIKVNNVEYRGLVFFETNVDDGTFEHNLLYNYGAPTNPSGGTGLAVKNWYSMTGWSILTGRAFANAQPVKETQITVQAGQITIEINYDRQTFTSPQITVPPETQAPAQVQQPVPAQAAPVFCNQVFNEVNNPSFRFRYLANQGGQLAQLSSPPSVENAGILLLVSDLQGFDHTKIKLRVYDENMQNQQEISAFASNQVQGLGAILFKEITLPGNKAYFEVIHKDMVCSPQPYEVNVVQQKPAAQQPGTPVQQPVQPAANCRDAFSSRTIKFWDKNWNYQNDLTGLDPKNIKVYISYNGNGFTEYPDGTYVHWIIEKDGFVVGSSGPNRDYDAQNGDWSKQFDRNNPSREISRGITVQLPDTLEQYGGQEINLRLEDGDGNVCIDNIELIVPSQQTQPAQVAQSSITINGKKYSCGVSIERLFDNQRIFSGFKVTITDEEAVLQRKNKLNFEYDLTHTSLGRQTSEAQITSINTYEKIFSIIPMSGVQYGLEVACQPTEPLASSATQQPTPQTQTTQQQISTQTQSQLAQQWSAVDSERINQNCKIQDGLLYYKNQYVNDQFMCTGGGRSGEELIETHCVSENENLKKSDQMTDYAHITHLPGTCQKYSASDQFCYFAKVTQKTTNCADYGMTCNSDRGCVAPQSRITGRVISPPSGLIYDPYGRIVGIIIN